MALKKTDRSLVQFSHSNSEIDYEWYNTRMGKQTQLIRLLEKQVTLQSEINDTLVEGQRILKAHRNMLQKEVDKFHGKIIVVQPWNLIKGKK